MRSLRPDSCPDPSQVRPRLGAAGIDPDGAGSIPAAMFRYKVAPDADEYALVIDREGASDRIDRAPYLAQGIEAAALAPVPSPTLAPTAVNRAVTLYDPKARLDAGHSTNPTEKREKGAAAQPAASVADRTRPFKRHCITFIPRGAPRWLPLIGAHVPSGPRP